MIGLWLLAGDFNDILSITGKKGGDKASLRKCNLFKARIDACKLLDLVLLDQSTLGDVLFIMEDNSFMNGRIEP